MLVPGLRRMAAPSARAADGACFPISFFPRRPIMRKLRLDPETLDVQSFDTASAVVEEGTVNAHQQTNPNANTCDPLQGTCFGFTCFRTCICTGPANPGNCGDRIPAPDEPV
jgi:hypothetical protein